jgi:Protein of unknown function (DUF2384)
MKEGSVPLRQAFETIAAAANREGHFDARQVANLLGWQADDIARFLGRSTSSLYRNPDAAATQDDLGKLVGLYQDMVKLLAPPQADALSAEAATRAWFRTSAYVLDGKSPKDKILAGDLDSVRRLVNEYASGIAF